MNNLYYECTVKFDRMQENGLMKKVSEKHLVEAISFSEAEARITKEVSKYGVGGLDITAIRRQQIAEIFESQGSKIEESAWRWYKGKLDFIFADESGKEKRSHVIVMIHATDFNDARNALEEGMKNTMADWEKTMLSETSIIDVYRYEKE